MSGTWPMPPKPNSLRVQSWYPSMVSVSHNLTRQTRSRGGQRWLFELMYRSLSQADFRTLFAFLVAQNGQYETFSFSPPLLKDARGAATTSPTVDGASQIGRSINTTGWNVSTSGLLLKGDFISFAGHPKVYVVSADVDSDGAGDAVVAFEPALMASPADAAAITYKDVAWTCALAEDYATLDIEPPDRSPLNVKFIEAMQ